MPPSGGFWGDIAQVFRGRANTPPPSSTAPNEEPSVCRYKLDDDDSETLQLKDGRTVGYVQSGAPQGRPVFYLHGLPGSRLEVRYWHDICLEKNVRMIGVDRPGYGLSSPQPDRTLLDHPKDITALADHLDLDTFRVMGISGGGPYAYTCAKEMPAHRLQAVAVVCGLGPMDIGMKGSDLMHKFGFPWGYTWTPGLSTWWWKRQTIARLDLPFTERLAMLKQEGSKMKSNGTNDKDIVITRDEHILKMSLRSAEQAFKQSAADVVHDGTVMCRPWPFRVEDIRKDLPIHIWHGKHDTFVPTNHAIQIAARMGKQARLHLVDEGHASIGFNLQTEILDSLFADD